MGAFTWSLVAAAGVLSVLIAYLAARRPILFRMAIRNAARRPRQTLTVIAGLMIGTAIISSALVAGDSAGSAIRGAVLDSLGHIDETVAIEAFPFFPQAVYDDLAADGRVAGWFDGVAPNVIWSVAGDNPRTDLFEPRVTLVGFDAERDVDFGDFHLQGGGRHDGRGLGPGDAIVGSELADALELRVGDTLRIAYSLPIDPLLPEVALLAGNVTAAEPVVELPVLGAPPIPRPAPSQHEIEVKDNATRLVTAIVYDPRESGEPLWQLRLELEAPNGTTYRSASPLGASTIPLWLNVSAPTGATLATGTWVLTVTSTAAADVAYQGAAAVLYPVYDLAGLQNRTRPGGGLDELLERFDMPRERLETSYRVVAIASGGRIGQFDLPHVAFVPMAPLQELLRREGQINVIKFSNPGSAAAGSRGTDEAMQRLEAALADVQDRQDHPAVAALEIAPLKRDFLRLADDTGQLLTGFLLFAGSLSIFTGLLLIINIFTMLAEERRAELGMARAVGMTRRDVIRLFVFEGSLYAVAAAAVGALIGVGLAFGMIYGLNALMAGAGPNRFPPVPFLVHPSAVLGAFAGGALLTFVTLAGASWRISRANVVRAIRGIEEPERSASRWQAVLGWPLALAGLAVAVFAWMPEVASRSGGFTLQVFGPLALVLGLGLALRRHVRRGRLHVALAAALAGYYAATYFAISEYADIQEANTIGPIRGVILTLCVVLIVTHWKAGPRWLGHRLARLRAMRAVATPAMSYPQHKRFRTGMTLAMFSLVILSIGFFSIFGALFERDAEVMTGGFDIEATTTLKVPDLAQYDRGLLPAGLVQSMHRLLDHDTFDAGFLTVNDQRTGQFGPPQHHVYGFQEPFIEDQRFRLLWRHEDYATDADAYRDVLAREDIVIVAYPYSTDRQGRDLSFGVGDKLQMHFGSGIRTFTIVGVQEQWHFSGVWLPYDLVERMFPDPDDLYLVKLAPGSDAEAAAKLMEKNYRDAGLDADASQVLVAKQQQAFRQILGAMKVFLGLGLVVGVLSLGIVTSRSVLERRQEIGMLRAIGYRPRQVRLLFFLEVTLVVALGGIIGIACSVLVTYGLWFAIIKDLQYPYVVPWSEILVLLGIAYVVALLATAAPIRRSARIPPAEAVRYAE
jgi:putative ABC transport system permease protein